MLDGLNSLRSLIYNQADLIPEIGEIQETLKWGQPSYNGSKGKGTPIRLGIEKKTIRFYGLYVNCCTKLIEDVKHIYGDTFLYSGNRSILFDDMDKLPEAKLAHVIDMALTYHSNKT
jgi:hypothetical protein